MIVKESTLSNIHPGAKIANDVCVEPFVTIQEDVEIGEGTWIGPHVTVMNGTRIGKNCKIFPGAVLGGIPQDLKYRGERTFLQIGDNVIVREYCTLNKGTSANDRTRIGNDCLLMAYVHIAHDCVIGDNCILANNVNLAGHITLGDYAVLGGLTAVHQFVQIGQHAMVGGGSLVRKDVPPFVKAARDPLAYAGVNSIGLKRRGFTAEDIHHIEDIYRNLFVKTLNTSQAIRSIKEEIEPSPLKSQILSFIDASERGLIRGYKSRK